MAARFVALPVNQGDAFLIEREGFRALVDGGKSRSQASALLKPLLSDRHLDAVVCTHNDKDHAEGVRGLLESQDLSVAEAWLPGRWMDRLIELCRSEENFFRELAGEVRGSNAKTLEDFAGRVRSDALNTGERDSAIGRREEEIESDGEDRELLEAIDGAADDPRWPWWWSPWPGPPNSLWVDAIDAAERIRAIAVAARNAGCRIRWFDHALFQRGREVQGGRPGLLPTNAVEIAGRPRRPRPSPLVFLSLSVANRESLVFRSPEDLDAPGVLFTADSDLAFRDGALQIRDVEIVTAPHHGSASNANAYSVVDRLASNPGMLKWVRSDGRFLARPGPEFLAKKAQAMCTRCRNHSSAAQRVELTGEGGMWTALSIVRTCQCI